MATVKEQELAKLRAMEDQNLAGVREEKLTLTALMLAHGGRALSDPVKYRESLILAQALATVLAIVARMEYEVQPEPRP